MPEPFRIQGDPYDDLGAARDRPHVDGKNFALHRRWMDSSAAQLSYVSTEASPLRRGNVGTQNHRNAAGSR